MEAEESMGAEGRKKLFMGVQALLRSSAENAAAQMAFDAVADVHLPEITRLVNEGADPFIKSQAADACLWWWFSQGGQPVADSCTRVYIPPSHRLWFSKPFLFPVILEGDLLEQFIDNLTPFVRNILRLPLTEKDIESVRARLRRTGEGEVMFKVKGTYEIYLDENFPLERAPRSEDWLTTN